LVRLDIDEINPSGANLAQTQWKNIYNLRDRDLVLEKQGIRDGEGRIKKANEDRLSHFENEDEDGKSGKRQGPP